jgi:hypothetical protein
MTEAVRYLLSSYSGPSPPPSAVTPTMASQFFLSQSFYRCNKQVYSVSMSGTCSLAARGATKKHGILPFICYMIRAKASSVGIMGGI